MAYAVKELFWSVQGEGVNAGRPAVFLRFSGCNLWTGRETERQRGRGACARWCDTDFLGTDGTGGGRYETAQELARAVAATAGGGDSRPSWPGVRLVVCTGGEPLLQLDEPLVAALHAEGFELAVETNGTLPLPPGCDWVSVSPKAGTELVVRSGDELKLVFPQPGAEPERFTQLEFRHFVLQPLDDPGRARHVEAALAYCLAHPRWRLGLQLHKELGVR